MSTAQVRGSASETWSYCVELHLLDAGIGAAEKIVWSKKAGCKLLKSKAMIDKTVWSCSKQVELRQGGGGSYWLK